MDEVLADADRNMQLLWRRMVASAGGVVEDREGVTLMASGIPIPMFNPAFVLGPSSDPAATLAEIAGFFADRSPGYAVYFRDETAPGFAEACAAAGMAEHWRPPLMVLDPIPDEDPPVPEGLTVEVVDAGNYDDYLGTLCAGFGMPMDLVAPFQGGTMLRIEGFTGLLGRVDGAAVAASGVFAEGRTAGVYNVATVPDRRGKGVGAAVTAAAARHGATTAGCTRAILQASEAGEPVYRRMGYATPDRYRQFEG
jgi:GNAT superfamily N-acetyltransferase